MKSVIIFKCDDWQACYIHGVSIDQNHSLGEGEGLLKFLQINSQIFGFELMDIKEIWANDVDTEDCESCGEFPGGLDELKGNYNFD